MALSRLSPTALTLAIALLLPGEPRCFAQTPDMQAPTSQTPAAQAPTTGAPAAPLALPASLPASQAQAASLAEVISLTDLQRQPPLDAGNGWTIRVGLGLQRADEPWRIVYALAEHESGTAPPMSYSGPYRGEPLGPVFVDLSRRGDPPRQMMIATSSLVEIAAAGPLWYTRTIPLADAGQFDLRIVRGDGAVLAERLVVVTENPTLHWMTFAAPQGGLDPQPAAAYPMATIAVRYETIASSGQTRPVPSDANPLPNQLSLKLENGRFEIAAPRTVRLDGSTADVLLARWWVNGRPVEAPRRMRAEAVQAAQVTVTRFPVAPLPSVVGAKPGDTVRLQLLYCPGGYRRFLPPGAQAVAASSFFSGSANAMISEPIEFKVTPEMVAP